MQHEISAKNKKIAIPINKFAGIPKVDDDDPPLVPDPPPSRPPASSPITGNGNSVDDPSKPISFSDGGRVGNPVGGSGKNIDGFLVGAMEGDFDGDVEGDWEGFCVGGIDGEVEGDFEGDVDGP